MNRSLALRTVASIALASFIAACSSSSDAQEPPLAGEAFDALIGIALAVAIGITLVALIAACAFIATATSVAIGFVRRSALDGLAAFLTFAGALAGIPAGAGAAWVIRSMIERPYDVSTTLFVGAACGPLLGGALGAALGIGLAWRRRATPASA